MLPCRYEQHTKHCTVCKAKLKETEATLARLPFIGAALFCVLCAVVGSFGLQRIAAGGLPAVAAGVAAVGIAACVASYKKAQAMFEQFHFVDWSHADNH